MRYIRDKDEAFGTVEVDIGWKRRIVSWIDSVVGFVKGDDSMALFPINLYRVLEEATEIEVQIRIPAA